MRVYRSQNRGGTSARIFKRLKSLEFSKTDFIGRFYDDDDDVDDNVDARAQNKTSRSKCDESLARFFFLIIHAIVGQAPSYGK